MKKEKSFRLFGLVSTVTRRRASIGLKFLIFKIYNNHFNESNTLLLKSECAVKNLKMYTLKSKSLYVLEWKKSAFTNIRYIVIKWHLFFCTGVTSILEYGYIWDLDSLSHQSRPPTQSTMSPEMLSLLIKYFHR